jgi:hypothetical protein
MADTITLKPTDVYTITIGLVDASGAVVPVPAGDVFSATSSSPAIAATIGTDANGNPALIVNALTLPDANTMGMTVTISDSAGDVADTLTVDYPVPPAPDDITLAVPAAVVSTQPEPTAPGP